MNRAERRREQKLGVSPQTIMEKYRKEAFDEGYTMGMQSVVEINFYMTIYTLSYKLNLSKEELRELAKAIYNNIDSYRSGHLTPQDYDTIVQQMEEEYEIKIR